MIKQLKSYEEFIGRKFNHLQIFNIFRDEHNIPIAECHCDCGKNKRINFQNVRSGKSKTCGCGERESRYGRCHAKYDIVGQKFGKLTVIRDPEKRTSSGAVLWECQCECGNLTYVNSSNLQRGHTLSCGCKVVDYVNSLKHDIIGNKYGQLTVIKELDRSKYNRRTYLCRCECGNEIIIDGGSLISGHTISCGCIKQSQGEYMIEFVLKDLDIPFVKEKRFSDCKNKKCLPFDFYLPTRNICIEYNGKQHYSPVDFWGGKDGFKKGK